MRPLLFFMADETPVPDGVPAAKTTRGKIILQENDINHPEMSGFSKRAVEVLPLQWRMLDAAAGRHCILPLRKRVPAPPLVSSLGFKT
jgi:hypothetical protein